MATETEVSTLKVFWRKYCTRKVSTMRTARWMAIVGLCLTVTLGIGGLTGCARFSAQAPTGFATYDKDGGAFRAVSPDSVMYRVREEKNKPKAELAFWKEALKKRMVDAGYHFVSETDVKADTSAGYLLELNAPQGNADFTYVTAIFVQDDRLIIVESAGEVSRFASRRSAVMDAIGKIRF